MKVATSYLERIVGRLMMVAPYPERIVGREAPYPERIVGRKAPYLERVVGRKISYLERIVGRFLLEMPVITAERTGGEGWFVVVFEPALVERIVVGRRVRRGQ